MIATMPTPQTGIFALGNNSFTLPIGATAYPVVGKCASPKPLDVFALFPHMHRLGTSMRLDLLRGDETSCLMRVPRWDFNWQQLYLYDEPVDLQNSDVLKSTCTYDTTSRTTPTYWGEGTDDEMCIFALYFTKR